MQSLHQTMGPVSAEHQNQQLQLQQPTEANQQQPSGMIETLSAADHGGTNLELMESQQQHLVQQQPLLIQLEPSSLAVDPSPSQQQQQQDQDQQQVVANNQQLHQLNQAQRSSSVNLLKQRHHHQIDGGVAAALAAGGEHGPDGGGPIVQWLLENYEIADHESLPRSSVYNHYLSHCRQVQLATVNAASFGKLIRSVFMGLKTRRLGTRGHSKYHYFGIRMKRHIKRAMVEEQRRHQQRQQLHHHVSPGCSTSQQNENSNLQNEVGTEGESETDSTTTAEGGRLSASNSSAPSNSKRLKKTPTSCGGAPSSAAAPNNRYAVDAGQVESSAGSGEPSQYGSYMSNGNNGHNGYRTEQPQQHHLMQMEGLVHELQEFGQHLGANWATLVDEHWPEREPGALEKQLIKLTGSNELADYLEPFESKYKAYYKRMIGLLAQLKFLEVEQLWQQFWHPQPTTSGMSSTTASTPAQASSEHPWVTSLGASNGTTPIQQATNCRSNNSSGTDAGLVPQASLNHDYTGPQLAYHQLYELTCHSLVIERINEIDYNLYEAMASFLFPDMLSPIPRTLAQLIRQFGKNIGPWIEMAVKEYDQQFVTEKSKSARAFGSALRRYTQLNNLSTASRTIWEKRSSLNQMSLDLSRVDLRDIEHQVSWMSRQQHHNPSHRLPTAATPQTPPPPPPTTTAGNNNLDQRQDNNNVEPQHHHQHLSVMQPAQLIQNFLHLLEDPYPANSWPDWCRNLVESRVCGLSFEEARNFVLKWNFYINLIINELTLRSAQSFGSFQLIRMLFDEYIFHLVVNRLAQAQRKTPGQLLSM